MKKSAAFTITELLIVVVIIAALALLAFWAVRTQVLKGYDARRKADIARIKVAVEEYEKDHDCYPPSELVVCDPGTGLRPYIEKIPCDPRTGASYFYDHDGSECPKWYRFYTTLENLESSGDFNYSSGSPNAPLRSGGWNFYGCRIGLCTPIDWDPNRPGPECDPNYASSTCYGRCIDNGLPANECQSWQ